MTSAVLAIIFIILLFFSVSLQRVFYHLGARELKRRARAGEMAAGKLYKLAAHGDNLRGFLWFLVVVFAALSFVFLGELLLFWPALIVILAIVWLSFVWLPNSKVSWLELEVIGWTAAPLSWLLETLHGPIAVIVNLFSRYSFRSFHTGIYEKSDLLALLDAQEKQADSRIDREAIDIARRGLVFGDQIVEDHMTPRGSVKTVGVSDEITPKLVDELHKSGQLLFPVVEGKPERIVGTLRLDDLIDLKKSGKVSSAMDPRVFYIHEDHSLARVLDAFYKTHHRLFIVVNKFEDFVGVITIENVLEQIIGRPVLSDFDDYAELKAVATHIARTAAGTEVESGTVQPNEGEQATAE